MRLFVGMKKLKNTWRKNCRKIKIKILYAYKIYECRPSVSSKKLLSILVLNATIFFLTKFLNETSQPVVNIYVDGIEMRLMNGLFINEIINEMAARGVPEIATV